MLLGIAEGATLSPVLLKGQVLSHSLMLRSFLNHGHLLHNVR